jgi:phosphoribosyl 1,2-cyclic phosphodiesterase
MQLYVLGSGSRGNCFAVVHEGAVLMVDAGFSATEIERRATIVGLSLDGLVGIALTHEHGDHATGVARLARTRRVPVFCSPGTWAALGARGEHRPLGAVSRMEVGPFTLAACPTSHDAAEPIALAIEGVDGTSIGFAYDLGRPTAAVRYLMRHRTAIVLEANHDELRLRTSSYPPSVQQRIAGAGGHLSNRAAAELLRELWHTGLGAVVLAHLSERCNDEREALEAIHPVLHEAGYRGLLCCARQDDPLQVIPVAGPPRAQLALML